MRKPNYNFFHRIYLALSGLFQALRRERHLKIHFIVAIFLITPLIWIKVPVINVWILISLLCLLIVAELFNTAIETTVDLITKQFSYRAKFAKDVSSSAVLILAILVLIFSIFIYWPSMYNLIVGVILGH